MDRKVTRIERNALKLALESAQERLKPFEKRYGISSEEFIRTMAAEELVNGDDEYIQWAGEYQLMLQLQMKFDKLQSDGC